MSREIKRDSVVQLAGGALRHKVWIVSDIQETDPSRAEELVSGAIEDVLSWNEDISAVWLLGDALRGDDSPALERIAEMYMAQMRRLSVPVCYLLGNHDMDLRRITGKPWFPLMERAKREQQWHLPGEIADFYFLRQLGETLVVFLGDHAAADGSWFTTHGGVSGDGRASYPHLPADYSALAKEIGRHDGPVIMASHYAFPGGQKPSPLLSPLLPLPDNVRLVLHGHAHIGDLVWNKDNPWERLNPIQGETIGQYNISALETTRSPGSHSALLTLGPDGPQELRIRCHQDREWLASYFKFS